MPQKKAAERARKAQRRGKAPSTAAGEFVREELEEFRKGRSRARSREQAIAIGLSQARRAGVEVPPPEAGQAREKTRRQARREVQQARRRKRS
jgi:hypothetical protein